MTRTVTPVAVATSPADAAAVVAVEQHHAELAGRLRAHVSELLESTGSEAFEPARRRAAAFLGGELAPHAAAEERALYPAAAGDPRGRLLVDGMLAEHTAIAQLVGEVASAGPVRAAAAGYALQVLFEVHLGKEDQLVLPLVAGNPSVSLADILAGMHELLGGHAAQHGAAGEEPHEQHAHGACGCGCGESDAEVPELDVRNVPHAIRHATVFGAFDAIPAGGALVLVAPHDPLPLLRQLSERAGGAIAVGYEQRGPDAWRLLLTRT